MSKINIDNFVEIYVSTALDLVGKKGEMPFSEFENIIRERVSEVMGISEKDVVYLHHSIHWAFFLGENPPLSYVQAKKRGEDPKVGLNGDSVDKSYLIKYILDNHKPYLMERAKQP